VGFFVPDLIFQIHYYSSSARINLTPPRARFDQPIGPNDDAAIQKETGIGIFAPGFNRSKGLRTAMHDR
jgi:hypothetical protein